MTTRPPVRILGVPLDLGAGRRGVDMGPSAIRNARVVEALRALEFDVRDEGDIPTPVVETLSDQTDPRARHLPEIVGVLEELAVRVRRIRESGGIPVVLGGDHSIAHGTVSGMTDPGAPPGELGLVWVDAHLDAHTSETTPSGNVHGMPVAAIFGRGPDIFTKIGGFPAGAPRIRPANLTQIGIRSVDAGEAHLPAELGFRVFTMEEVDRRGIHPVVEDAVGCALDGTRGFHLSIDMDALDPDVAPGVGTPATGGLTYREAHTLMECVAASGGLRSLEIAEVNPTLDVRNRTARLAVELIASAFGKRTLPYAGTGRSGSPR